MEALRVLKFQPTYYFFQDIIHKYKSNVDDTSSSTNNFLVFTFIFLTTWVVRGGEWSMTNLYDVFHVFSSLKLA